MTKADIHPEHINPLEDERLYLHAEVARLREVLEQIGALTIGTLVHPSIAVYRLVCAALSDTADDWKCPSCERLRKRHAAFRDTLAGIASASCCLSPGCDVDDPHCDAMMAEAALHYDEDADDWLAAHDEEVRREERERCVGIILSYKIHGDPLPNHPRDRLPEAIAAAIYKEINDG